MLDEQRTEVCVIAPKLTSNVVGANKMIDDPKHEPLQDDGDSEKRRRLEEALDDALKNTFPASDPVSVEQLINLTSPQRKPLRVGDLFVADVS